MDPNCSLCHGSSVESLLAEVLPQLPVHLCAVVTRYASPRVVDVHTSADPILAGAIDPAGVLWLVREQHLSFHANGCTESTRSFRYSWNAPHSAWFAVGQDRGVYLSFPHADQRLLDVCWFTKNSSPRFDHKMPMLLPRHAVGNTCPAKIRLGHAGDDRFLFGWSGSRDEAVVYSLGEHRGQVNRVRAKDNPHLFVEWGVARRRKSFQLCVRCRTWGGYDMEHDRWFCVRQSPGTPMKYSNISSMQSSGGARGDG